MSGQRQHLILQAGRILDHLQTLWDHYEDEIAGPEPQLAEALKNAIESLDDFVARNGQKATDPIG